MKASLLLLGLVWSAVCAHADTPGVKVQYFPNTVFCETNSVIRLNTPLGYTAWPPTNDTDLSWDYFSARWTGAIIPPYNGTYHFSCESGTATTVYLWIDDHVFCPNSPYTEQQLPLIGGRAYDIRAEYQHINRRDHSPLLFQWVWNSTETGKPNQTTPIAIDTKYTTNVPTQPSVSAHRDALRSRLNNAGWGTYVNYDMLSHVYLPDGFNLQLGLWDSMTQQVLQGAYVETISSTPTTIRPGFHSWSGSRYTHVTITFNDMKLIITSTVTGETTQGDLQLLITPISNATIASRYLLLVIPSYKWLRQGVIDMSSSSFPYIVSTGMGTSTVFQVYATQHPRVHTGIPDGVVKGDYIAFSLNEEFAITTGSLYSVSTVRTATNIALAAELAPLESYKQHGLDVYDSYLAMQSVLAWMTIYTPYEGVIMPVTRSWNFGFDYVLFDWDSYFAGYMASYSQHPTARDVAYNTVIQTTKARSTNPDGTSFVPNYTSGPKKSRDRSEPQVGSKVIAELYQWYHDTWLVELVYPDLLAWNTWTWVHRRVEPYNLIVLGSDPSTTLGDGEINDLQAAKYESGLDNSPMYTEASFDSIVTHKMNLYDVGMASMYVMDCDALITLATALNKHDDIILLQTRRNAIAQAIQQHLWNEQAQVYQNLFTDTQQFSYHVSPTNFYPMLAGISNLTQVTGMNSRWLSNATEMCITGTCTGAGMPSITRSDPAFHENSYWRGRIWGPELQLMYWCLSHPSYHSNPDITSTRTTLLAQARSMLLQEWRAYGHVHENYNGDTGIGCDVTNSDPYYTWGALSGFISILEYMGAPPSHSSHASPATPVLMASH